MFREGEIVSRRVLILAMSAILAAIAFAAVATVWLVMETRKEQRAVAELLSEGSATVTRNVGTLPGELRWQLVFSVLVLLVLVAAAFALVRLFRAFLVAQDSVREVKMLSWNILASMGHAVLTTNREGAITSINPRGYELLNVTSDCMGRPITATKPDL